MAVNTTNNGGSFSRKKQPQKIIDTYVSERAQAEKALLDSQGMFRQLFEAAPDANILVDKKFRIRAANRQTELLFGYRREELIGQPISILLPSRYNVPDMENRVMSVLSMGSRPISMGINLYGVDKTAHEFPIDMTLSSIKSGEDILAVGVIRDISRYKTAEEILRTQAAFLKLMQDIAIAANEATTVETAMQFTVDAICDYVDWPVGHAFMRDTDGKMRSMRIWHIDDPERYANFQRVSEIGYYPVGFGLPGEILEKAAPVWWINLQETKQFRRYREAVGCGLSSAFAFPVLIGKDVVAVLEFFSTEQARPGDMLVEVMIQIGTQLGRVIERKQAESNLSKSEARFRTIFEEAPMGIKLIDLDGRIIDNNTAYERMLGYSPDELHSKLFTDVTHPADLSQNLAQFRALLNGEIETFTLEKRYVHKSGKLVWGLSTMSLVRGPEGEPQFAIGMVEDISRRKAVEAELTEVQHRLIESAEGERLRLAQELHDGPIQDLYGVAFQLQEIEAGMYGRNSQVSVSETKSNLQQVISLLRTISGEMRPPTLAPFGLEKAIRSHADRFREAYPEIKIHLEMMSDHQMLSETVRLGLFRIYQQLLSNVIRHAHASEMTVRLYLEDESITLEVEDNGQGFQVPRRWIEIARQGHMGLVGASERAEALGGHLVIHSQPGKGSRIRAVVPLSK